MEKRKRCEKCNSTMVYLRIKHKNLFVEVVVILEKVKGGLKNE